MSDPTAHEGPKANIKASLRERLIVALDVSSVEAAEHMVERLGDSVIFYKIGMELTYSGGLPLVQKLASSGKRVFLDLKLHDIPHTVEMAVARVANLGATYLTVHAYPQTMIAAKRGARGSSLKILGVTVMTSMEDKDLALAGYRLNVADLVTQRALQAEESGIDGLICSAADIGGLRRHIGTKLEIITPGIRPKGGDIGDQKRIMTPSQALHAGADRIVIGRPILEAKDPRRAADAIIAEMATAT